MFIKWMNNGNDNNRKMIVVLVKRLQWHGKAMVVGGNEDDNQKIKTLSWKSATRNEQKRDCVCTTQFFQSMVYRWLYGVGIRVLCWASRNEKRETE